MGTVKASNLEQAKQLLQSGDAIKLELDFELDSDEFFNFAIEYCTNGTKLTRAGDRFLISRKKSSLRVIPAIHSITEAYVFRICDALRHNKNIRRN